MGLISTTDTAEKWNITRRRIATLCKEGRIDGAVLIGGNWLVPEDAKKPEDNRRHPKSAEKNAAGKGTIHG